MMRADGANRGRSGISARGKAGAGSRADEGGFTLLEVLLATALTVIVMGAVYGTFFLLQRAAGGGQQSLQRLYEAQKTMDMLRRELEAAKGPMTVVDKEYFGHKGSTLSFTAFSPANGVLSTIIYSARATEGGGQGETIDLEKEQKAPGGRTEKADLLDNIGEFSVQVFSGGKWVRTIEADQPPQDIKVTLKISFKGRPFVLQEIAAPRIGNQL
ncbi:MAG: prepilin-type N-terminal cleavage/methylation domain-containing protein [Nitrospiraceae bacterium]|nr:prepilin-type N-terminal cleavage/methylation domain-containing protein [Nitrospiraceae bacterium]